MTAPTRTVVTRLLEALIIGGVVVYGNYRVMEYRIESQAAKIIEQGAILKVHAIAISGLSERAARVETRIQIAESRIERVEDQQHD